ncbi:MAG: hypothetical protein DBX55_05650 [Verrucomicrobia bacterium]|nr:MAG: hypothetical protein DBX55_05650 [Verrucomicrobiota bacterium]
MSNFFLQSANPISDFSRNAADSKCPQFLYPKILPYSFRKTPFRNALPLPPETSGRANEENALSDADFPHFHPE